MKTPYATLLNQYRDHWALWPFLEGEIPDFHAIFESHAYDVCSRGEQIVILVALAIWNGDRRAAIADLAGLDDANRHRVLDALHHALQATA